jgi:hypothetical protein
MVYPEVAQVPPELREPANLQNEKQNLGWDVGQEAVKVEPDELILGSLYIYNQRSPGNHFILMGRLCCRLIDFRFACIFAHLAVTALWKSSGHNLVLLLLLASGLPRFGAVTCAEPIVY